MTSGRPPLPAAATSTGRPAGIRKAAGAVLAVGAAVAVDAALPAGGPPIVTWDGAVGTPLRIVAAAALGGMASLVLASVTSPTRLPARLRAVRVGLARPTRGRGLLVARVVLEEAAWRAVLLPVLALAFGMPFAVVGSSVLFGVWHVHQGARGMLANCLNGGVFAASYLLLGGLPAAIVTHSVHNLVLAALLAGRPRPEPGGGSRPGQPQTGQHR